MVGIGFELPDLLSGKSSPVLRTSEPMLPSPTRKQGHARTQR